MSSLYLNADSDEVVAVVPDGVHPGRLVVEDEWNSRPHPKFRCVHVPGAPVQDFADLQEREPSGDLINVIDFLPAQAATMAKKRMITLPAAALRRRRRRGRPQ